MVRLESGIWIYEKTDMVRPAYDWNKNACELDIQLTGTLKWIRNIQDQLDDINQQIRKMK